MQVEDVHTVAADQVLGEEGRWLRRGQGGVVAARAPEALGHHLSALGVPHDVKTYDGAGHSFFSQVDGWQGWLARVPSEGALLFCHPGAPSASPSPGADPIAAARVRELAYLRSEDFASDLAAAGVALGPVWRWASSFCRRAPPHTARRCATRPR